MTGVSNHSIVPEIMLSIISLIAVSTVSSEGFQVVRENIPYGTELRGELSGKVLQDISTTNANDDIMLPSSTNVLKCECGVFSRKDDDLTRWENEKVSFLNVYPWSVSLVAPGGMFAFCGGSLINDRYVLTSAACVDGSNAEGVEALIGTWPAAHLSEDDSLNTTNLFRKAVVRVIIHPLYADGHLDYNIALLRLKGPVPTFGTRGAVTPVCLPNPEESDLVQGMNASSLLWRFDEYGGAIVPRHRSEVDWVVLGQQECRNLDYNDQWTKMPETMLCAKTDEPAADHPFHLTYDCPGDAGGPLVITSGYQKVQIGIDSWTACYSKPSGVGLFTRVSEFLPWIKSHISEDGRHCSM
ncbi:transmembrane protease serine 9 isoform X2 [Folsomia candida]|uniref:Serine proteinase stubble n=1 Tax=Folsomia candida TaxID=158441 RepID=A0A226EQY1_FOLCA|nr:transmembrane protease serine 9 isoform X2 [Folsomia candida]OXA59670.1 Serine proteinase stubble [Folsomia candida]